MSEVWVLRRVEVGYPLSSLDIAVCESLDVAREVAALNIAPRPKDTARLTWEWSTDWIWTTRPVTVLTPGWPPREVWFRAERFEVQGQAR